jgi:hypothetical protein
VDADHPSSPSPSFFRNSGVYIFNHYEIQIFDTYAVLAAIGNHANPHQHVYDVTVDGLTVSPDGVVDAGMVKLHHHEYERIRDWSEEPVKGCISGVPYKKVDMTTFADLVLGY